METKLLYQPLAQVEADAVAIILFEEEAAPADLKFASAWLDELKTSGEFSGKSAELAVLHQPQGVKAKRIVAVGGGKKAEFDSAALRKAAASTVRTLKQKGVKSLACILEGRDAEAAVDGAMLGNF
jgi:leucyl aminopeptidase